MRHRLVPTWLAAATVAVVAAPITRAADPTPLPADLAMVHPDALGFVHVRLADVWKHEAMANARMLVDKAGPDALAAFDGMFVPKPSTAERVTAIVLPPTNDPDPQIVVAMQFTRPFDPAAAARAWSPGAVAKRVGEKVVYLEPSAGGLYFPDDRTMVYGPGETLESYLTWAPKADGGLSRAVELARSETSPVVTAMNVATVPIPPRELADVPPEFRPLLSTRLVVATMDLAAQVTVTARLIYSDPAAATEGERALLTAAKLARSQLRELKSEPEKMLFAEMPADGFRPTEELPKAVLGLALIGAINYADEIIADFPVKRDADTLTASVTLPPWMTQYVGSAVVSAGLMIPAVQSVRDAAQRMTSQNNLKQIALAMHNYESAYAHFPPAAITDKKTGKKLLSWRVAILPYIDEDALYRRFKLDEPWDSEANLKAAAYMPRVYHDPRLPGTTFKRIGGNEPVMPDKTYYKVFTGNGAAFSDDGSPVRITDFTDGTSNTLMAVSGGEPVIWSKPDDIPFDPTKPLPDLSKPFDVLLAAMCDGSVQTLRPKDLADKTLKARITKSGGEVIEYDE